MTAPAKPGCVLDGQMSPAVQPVDGDQTTARQVSYPLCASPSTSFEIALAFGAVPVSDGRHPSLSGQARAPARVHWRACGTAGETASGRGRSVAGWAGGNVQRSAVLSLLAAVRLIVEEAPLERAGDASETIMGSTVHFRAVLCPTLAPTAE